MVNQGRAFFFALSALALLALGCSKSAADPGLAQRCERALAKVTLAESYESPEAKGKPSEAEKAVIDSVKKASQVLCEAEGLTQEQAACFEGIKDVETLFQAADCPAIAAKKPSWFKVPPPDIRRAALERMRARPEAE